MSDLRNGAGLIDQQERLVALFATAPMKATFGMELSYGETGAVFDMPYRDGFDHALGAIHGGVFATLLDNAGWFTVAAHYPTWVVTVELTTRLHEPVSREDLRATGRLVRAGKRIAVAEMEVRTASGVLAATGSGTFAVTSKRYD